MKNYRDANPNKIDNVLCALIVVMVVGAVGYGALGPMLASFGVSLSA